MRAVVSKRGVDDGNQKGGGSTQPAKKSHFHSSRSEEIVKGIFQYILKNFASYSPSPGNFERNGGSGSREDILTHLKTHSNMRA